MSERGDQIRTYVISEVRDHPAAIASLVAEKFDISPQAANRYLAELVDQGILIANGNTQAKRYQLANLDVVRNILPLSSHLEEDVIWRQLIQPRITGIPENVSTICQYGFTEMANNAIDHSNGSNLSIMMSRTAADITLWIEDDGVGIFNKIAAALNLPDPRQALIELAKGKLTTDAIRHSGEGIFFTSRVFDDFVILSDQLSFLHQDGGDDWLLPDRNEKGTSVCMRHNLDSDRVLKDVFDKFTSEKDDKMGFTKTHVPLKLAQVGDANLISRSQAKRVLNRVDRFEEVWLDFDDVKLIGQGFADEIFRVFARQNPNIRLVIVNASGDVRHMIDRAKAVAAEQNG